MPKKRKPKSSKETGNDDAASPPRTADDFDPERQSERESVDPPPRRDESDVPEPRLPESRTRPNDNVCARLTRSILIAAFALAASVSVSPNASAGIRGSVYVHDETGRIIEIQINGRYRGVQDPGATAECSVDDGADPCSRQRSSLITTHSATAATNSRSS